MHPPRLDYQTLEVDSDRTLTCTVTNPVDLPLTSRWAAPAPEQFTADTVTMPPHATQQVNARYLPRALGDSAAQLLEVRSCDGLHADRRWTLTGSSVASAFVFDPAPVPFERHPGARDARARITRATNITWRPVHHRAG